MNKKLICPAQCSLDRWVQTVSAIGASLALLYYLAMGLFVGFGVSLLFVWLLFALFLGAIALQFPALRRWWKTQKRSLRVILTACAVMLLLLAILFAGAILSGFFSDIPDDESVDCLIILGAQVKPTHPSLALAERIEAAYDYLACHPDTVAIASGGQGADEPISEAQCIYDCLVEMGISPDRIILEDRSTSTAENLRFSAELLPDGCQSIAIVTNNFHAFRGEATARKVLDDMDIYHLSADFHPFMLPHYLVRECAALLADILRGNLTFVD